MDKKPPKTISLSPKRGLNSSSIEKLTRAALQVELPEREPQNKKSMSEKSKMRRAQREARQEKQAKQVIYWLVGVLALLALILLIYAMKS